MAETIGSLCDKISILELRRIYTERLMLDATAPEDTRHECALRLRVIDEQRADLLAEVDALFVAIRRGEHVPKIYRQLKMYNDPQLRSASRSG